MKNRNVLCLLLIALCLALLFGYRAVDRLGTDAAAPQINMSAETLQVSVQDARSALLQGVTATDETDGDVTASLVVESVSLKDPDGTVLVGYAAFDKAGNVAKAQRVAQYMDYESPRFSLSKPLVFTQEQSFDVLGIIGARDTLDGDISHRIRAGSLDEASINTLGTHEVEFRVTNSLGETVKLVLPVEVSPSGTYQGSLTLTDYLIYLPAGSLFSAQSYLDSYSRGAETVSLRAGLPENYSLRTTGTVDTTVPGVYPVAYKLTYTIVNEANPDLNQSYTAYSKLIVVVEG